MIFIWKYLINQFWRIVFLTPDSGKESQESWKGKGQSTTTNSPLTSYQPECFCLQWKEEKVWEKNVISYKTKNKRRLKVVNFRLLSMYLSLHVPTLWLADTNCPPQRNHVERNQMKPASTFYYSLKKLSWIPWSFLFPSTQKFLREELTFYMIFTHLCSRWFLRKHPKYSLCLLKYYAYHVLLWAFFGHIHCKNTGTGR